jgi:hypothetical protein
LEFKKKLLIKNTTKSENLKTIGARGVVTRFQRKKIWAAFFETTNKHAFMKVSAN